jgi:hypothetical protein
MVIINQVFLVSPFPSLSKRLNFSRKKGDPRRKKNHQFNGYLNISQYFYARQPCAGVEIKRSGKQTSNAALCLYRFVLSSVGAKRMVTNLSWVVGKMSESDI